MSKKTKSPKQKSIIQLFFSGFAMGSADIVPGVSGGTVALIVGVYEELIHSIKKTSGHVVKLAAKGKLKEAFLEVPFHFLVPLGLGLLTAVITLSKTLEWLLLDYPVFLWSFFFGLVVASLFLVGKRVHQWNLTNVTGLVIGAIAAYFIVGLVPVETPATLPAFFISGAIAICAMILPGVSGSFLLIIMGKYSQILSAVSNHDFVTLGAVALGAVIGLSVFSRVLSWLFDTYHNLMMAVLTGVMLGSLRKIWPWKVTLETYFDSHGLETPLVQRNILPPNYDQTFLFALILAGVGMIIIGYLSKFERED